MRIGIAALAACALGIHVGVARAGDDAEFGGAGADLVALAPNNVEMRSEDIVLTIDDMKWSVQARYVLMNQGPASVTLPLGFPEYRCNDPNDCRDAPFEKVVTKVDGKTVEPKGGELDKKHEWASYFGGLWTFEATFPSKREVVIEREYTLPAGSNAVGDRFTTYVTRVGKSFKGSVGNAKFTAVLPPYAHTVANPVVPGATVLPPRLVTEGKPRVELVIEASGWEPRGEVNISWNGTARFAGARLPAVRTLWQDPVVAYAALFAQLDCLEKGAARADEARGCTNLVYASKGYSFKTQALGEYFYGASPQFRLVKTDRKDAAFWVRTLSALPTFSVASIEGEERAMLQRLALASHTDAVTTLPGGEKLPDPVEDAAAVPNIAPPTGAATPKSTTSAAPAETTTQPEARKNSCGCRVVGAGETSSGAAAFVLAFVLTLARRRRGAGR